MARRQARIPLFGNFLEQSDQHEVLEVAIVKQLVEDLMPVLLDESDRSDTALDRIQYYLFEQNYLHHPQLLIDVNDELHAALYGLKTLLKRHHLNIIELSLEEHERQFRQFLRRELEG